MTEPTGITRADVAGFVAKLKQWISELTDDERSILDTLVAGAPAGALAGEVEGFMYDRFKTVEGGQNPMIRKGPGDFVLGGPGGGPGESAFDQITAAITYPTNKWGEWLDSLGG